MRHILILVSAIGFSFIVGLYVGGHRNEVKSGVLSETFKVNGKALEDIWTKVGTVGAGDVWFDSTTHVLAIVRDGKGLLTFKDGDGMLLFDIYRDGFRNITVNYSNGHDALLSYVRQGGRRELYVDKNMTGVPQARYIDDGKITQLEYSDCKFTPSKKAINVNLDW